jgi:hypothetical protein
MSKNISVKVKVSVLITALRKALAERNERYANNEKSEADYKKAHDKWKADFQKAVLSAVKNGKAKPQSAQLISHRYGANVDEKSELVELSIVVPKALLATEPERPETYREWEYKTDREALENAIRVLEMSDQEVVSTSTYHSVVKYL